MLYVPRHLPNRLEYKVLSCISVHYQSRMTSNEIAITPSRLHSAGRAMVLFKTNMLGGREDISKLFWCSNCVPCQHSHVCRQFAGLFVDVLRLLG